MGTLGLFLFVLLILGGGLGMAVLTGILSYRRFRHVGYTVSWVLGTITGTCALIFSLIALAFGGFGSDADTGAFDTFKTPLGGGFYLLSIDTSNPLPLPLAHRDDGDTISQDSGSTVVGLACVQGTVALKFASGYGRIDPEARTLERFDSADRLARNLNVPLGGLTWQDLVGFGQTECVNVPVSASDQFRTTGGMLVGPLVSGLILIGLSWWGARLRATRPIRPSHKEW